MRLFTNKKGNAAIAAASASYVIRNGYEKEDKYVKGYQIFYSKDKPKNRFSQFVYPGEKQKSIQTNNTKRNIINKDIFISKLKSKNYKHIRIVINRY